MKNRSNSNSVINKNNSNNYSRENSIENRINKKLPAVNNIVNNSSKSLFKYQEKDYINYNDNILINSNYNAESVQCKSVTPSRKNFSNKLLITPENNTNNKSNNIPKKKQNFTHYLTNNPPINEIKTKKLTNVTVAVRKRPLSRKEIDFNSFNIVRVLNNKMVILLDPYEYNGHNEVFKNRNKEQHYAFDYAFDENINQEEVFNKTVLPLIDCVLDGFNCTIFAYGATGAGKTYTMFGNDNNPGLIPLCLINLFSMIDNLKDTKTINVKLWYLEIYNENLRDLIKLDINDNNSQQIDIREDPHKGSTVYGITEMSVSSSQEVLSILRKANKNRTTESTNANEVSSRSHAVIQIQVEVKEKSEGIEVEIINSKFSLIDLAGSERASATQNKGIRLIEGANINRSLLTLGNCITALSESSTNNDITKNSRYVPYRDSKLTRILKDSLGGNSKTVMIANISPSVVSFDDTYNTLKYANRAKNIKTNVVKNTYNVQHHIANYEGIINNLKKEVNDLKSKLNSSALSNNLENEKSVINCFDKNNSNFITNKSLNSFINDLSNAFQEELKITYSIIKLKNKVLKNLFSKEYNNVNEQTYDDAIKESIKKLSNKSIIDLDNKKEVYNIKTIKNENENIINNSKINDEITNAEVEIERLYNCINNRSSLRNQIYNKYSGIFLENSLNINYLDILYNNITKKQDLKLENIEYETDVKIKDEVLGKKDYYIKMLEYQLRIRDDIINNNQIDNQININKEYKSIKELKNTYNNKVPRIQNYLKKLQFNKANSIDTSSKCHSNKDLITIDNYNTNIRINNEFVRHKNISSSKEYKNNINNNIYNYLPPINNSNKNNLLLKNNAKASKLNTQQNNNVKNYNNNQNNTNNYVSMTNPNNSNSNYNKKYVSKIQTNSKIKSNYSKNKNIINNNSIKHKNYVLNNNRNALNNRSNNNNNNNNKSNKCEVSKFNTNEYDNHYNLNNKFNNNINNQLRHSNNNSAIISYVKNDNIAISNNINNDLSELINANYVNSLNNAYNSNSLVIEELNDNNKKIRASDLTKGKLIRKKEVINHLYTRGQHSNANSAAKIN